jgi:hypothetical protein
VANEPSRKRSSNKNNATTPVRRGGRTGGVGGEGPTWPNVDEQLAHAKAMPGSALEKLIRENQDVEMLRPEEANDKLRLPAWIRIHWRKQHPNADYSGTSGGYPLHLTLLHQWMLEHQDLPGYTLTPPRPGGSSRRGE